MELKKVHAKDDGTYYWNCDVDDEYVLSSIRIAFIAGGVVCAVVMLLAVILSPDVKNILLVLACCAGGMLFILLLCGIIWLTRKIQWQTYDLTDEFVRWGRTSRDRSSVLFRDVLRTEEEGNKIRLFTKYRKCLVYIPEEDFPAIRDYILAKVEEKSKFH